MAGDDGRRAAFADDADVAEAASRQQIGDGVGTAVHLVAAGRVGPHRLDADQVFEVGPHRRQHIADAVDQITHADEVNAREQTQTRTPGSGFACE